MLKAVINQQTPDPFASNGYAGEINGYDAAVRTIKYQAHPMLEVLVKAHPEVVHLQDVVAGTYFTPLTWAIMSYNDVTAVKIMLRWARSPLPMDIEWNSVEFGNQVEEELYERFSDREALDMLTLLAVAGILENQDILRKQYQQQGASDGVFRVPTLP